MSRQTPEPDPAPASERWEALARHLAGESPAAEAEELRRWLAEEPARAELLEALERSLRPLEFSPPRDLDVEAALRAALSRLHEPDVRSLDVARNVRERRRSGWSRVSLRVAAAVTLAAGAVFAWWATTRDEPRDAVAVTARTFETPVGQTDSLQLADGSRILLGPASRLVVTADYGAQDRVVELSGLAHFDVTHDEARPFIVRAGAATVRDLGTTFTVQGAPGEDVEVAVTAGSVLLRATQAVEELGLLLRAGDRGVVTRTGHAVAERGVVSDDDLAWTRGRLVFREASLDEVSAALRRWYGVELRVADASFAGRHLTATFEGEAVQEVVDVIGMAFGARIELRGDTAILRALPAGPPR